MTRARLAAGFLLVISSILAFLAIARRQPAPEPQGSLDNQAELRRYESEVGASNLALFVVQQIERRR